MGMAEKIKKCEQRSQFSHVVMQKKKIVLAFGVFDALHDGHRFFLREARTHDELLIVAVAQDAVVRELKGRTPKEPLRKRLAAVRKEGLADRVVQGDARINDWSILKRFRPDVVALGYDQTELGKELRVYITKENLPIQVTKIAAWNLTRLHSRFLRGK